MKEKPLKKEIPTQIDFIKKIALDIVMRANSGTDPSISERLSYYAGFHSGSNNKFDLETTGMAGESVDIFTLVDGDKKTAIRLGWGEESVFFLNKDAIKDKMISKFKKHEEIKSFDDLVKTIHGFIRLEPKEGEIIDVSEKAKDERMKINNQTHSELPAFFTNPPPPSTE